VVIVFDNHFDLWIGDKQFTQFDFGNITKNHAAQAAILEDGLAELFDRDAPVLQNVHGYNLEGRLSRPSLENRFNPRPDTSCEPLRCF
jgi:hypothetical protein